MKVKGISSGTVHKLPQDLRFALGSKPKAILAWEDITPLSRNEWICWIESVKKEETRKNHVKRAVTELAEGKRRPCCWVGCVHRKDRVASSFQRHVVRARSKKIQ